MIISCEIKAIEKRIDKLKAHLPTLRDCRDNYTDVDVDYDDRRVRSTET